MKRKSIRSFRGLHALIEHPASVDRAVLQSQLEQLGLRVTTVDELSGQPGPDVDVYFFDADRFAGHVEEGDDLQSHDLPCIALIGFEAPSRLEALLARQPSAYLTKPIRRTGVYSCLAVGMHQYSALRETHCRLQVAEERVRLRRKVISAVVQLMRRGQLDEDEAYRVLQRGSMTHRISIEALSLRIISSQQSMAELLGRYGGDRRHGLALHHNTRHRLAEVKNNDRKEWKKIQ
jgi:AmiR/NasT family two-component response regulator